MAISMNENYLKIAESVALLSRCTRTRIGSIIVLKDKIISYGWNGNSKCTYENCYRTAAKSNNSENEGFCIGAHAEWRALMNIEVDLSGAILYCTMKPCNICARMIIERGIKKVVYGMDYQDGQNDKLFKNAEVELIEIKEQINLDEIVKQLAKLDQQGQEYIDANLKQLLKQVKYDYK